MTKYFRPIVQQDAVRPDGALMLAGGPLWFDRVEVLHRDRPSVIADVSALPCEVAKKLTAQRANVCGVSMGEPVIMGVLNVTPDSFSDGGLHIEPVEAARQMFADGANIVDIGGESTRPGAETISIDVETSRVLPVIKAMRDQGLGPVSIDTRKPEVAVAAIGAGAGLFNDVSALTFSPNSLDTAAKLGVPVCLMHAGGPPETMQDDPAYNHVLLDVYDYLTARVDACIDAGIERRNIMIDPGIGFGKTIEHNLTLIRGLSVFHGLGCPILLGVSRKGMIGRISNTPDPKQRFAGSMAIALEGLRQGVQMLRVHDIAQTKQAIDLWQAMIGTTHDT